MLLFLTGLITGNLISKTHAGINLNLLTDGTHSKVEHRPDLRNEAPVVVSEIREKFVAANDTFDLYLSEPVFTDPDNDTLFVSAALSDGSPLPDWITFTNSGTGSGYFTGIAPENGSLDITVTAADPGGLETSSTFQLSIADDVSCTNSDYFIVVESMPQLIGGLASLQEQVRYTADALTAETEGRVVVQFIVGLDGDIYNPQVIRGIGNGLDEEALRVMQYGNFVPGYQRGEAVCVQYSLPIVFRLDDHSLTGSLILHPVDDQLLASGEDFLFTIPDTTFVDPQMPLGTLQAYSKGYSDLPDWLLFTPDTKGGGTFQGTAPAPDTLTIELKPENLDAYHPFQIYIQDEVSVSTESVETSNPNKIRLHQNFPNPFNPVTTIRFRLPEPGIVDLSVYDSAGRLVKQLITGRLSSGVHTVSFDGSNLSSGLYHYSLKIGSTSVVRTMALIK